jgi:hypothetical protein
MPKVTVAKLEMAEGFAKVWNYKGIAIALDTPQLTFACDFANMLFTSFFEQQQALAKAKLGLPQSKMQGEIGVAPKPEPKLIVEG